MNEKILNKDMRIENNMLIITKNTETVMNKMEIENKLMQLNTDNGVKEI